MATLPHAPLLLETLLFKHQFKEHIAELDRQANVFETACDEVGGRNEGWNLYNSLCAIPSSPSSPSVSYRSSRRDGYNGSSRSSSCSATS